MDAALSLALKKGEQRGTDACFPQAVGSQCSVSTGQGGNFLGRGVALNPDSVQASGEQQGLWGG